MNEFRAPERTAKTCPIKAQSAAVARATASIGNAGRTRFGGASGCAGFVHRFSVLKIGTDHPCQQREDIFYSERMHARRKAGGNIIIARMRREHWHGDDALLTLEEHERSRGSWEREHGM